MQSGYICCLHRWEWDTAGGKHSGYNPKSTRWSTVQTVHIMTLSKQQAWPSYNSQDRAVFRNVVNSVWFLVVCFLTMLSTTITAGISCSSVSGMLPLQEDRDHVRTNSLERKDKGILSVLKAWGNGYYYFKEQKCFNIWITILLFSNICEILFLYLKNRNSLSGLERVQFWTKELFGTTPLLFGYSKCLTLMY